MAAAYVSSMKSSDIIQGSICLETHNKPQSLPCTHTFCLQCLQEHCEDNEQGEVTCPLRRKVFTIPPGGNKDLPNNLFNLQLLQASKLADVLKNEECSNKHLCEVCSDAEAEITSTSYCIECDQHICERCSMTHKKMKGTRSHQVICEADFTTSAEKRMKLTVSYCDQHPAEQNRLYCNDCKVVACHVCSVNKHKKHDLTDVNDSADKFREQIENDVRNVAACALKKLEKSKQLEIDKNLFMENISTTESEISQKCDQLMSLIQSYKIKLMEELSEFKNKILKEVATVKDEKEREFMIMESFKSYCQRMMNKGTACDISRAAHDIHARAEELVKTQDEPDCHILSGVEITLKPSLSTTDSTVKNFIGELLLRETGCSKDTRKLDFPKLLGGLTVRHVMPSTGPAVSGIAVLGDELFVVRNTSQQVHVYKSDDFTLIRDLTITGSTAPRGLVACAQYNCLYAVDPGQKIIYRHDLTNNVTNNWLVGEYCDRLSLTKCCNILTTLWNTKRIQEYTTHGRLVREISLDSSIDRPYHSVQLSTGNYVVCHVRTQQHRVCMVDQNGRIIQSYGGPGGAGVGQLNNPCQLAVDMHDNVLVADWFNHRVQLLSPTLTYLGDIVIPDHQLNSPYVFCFNKLNHRLYIGESQVGRVFVLDVNC